MTQREGRKRQLSRRLAPLRLEYDGTELLCMTESDDRAELKADVSFGPPLCMGTTRGFKQDRECLFQMRSALVLFIAQHRLHTL